MHRLILRTKYDSINMLGMEHGMHEAGFTLMEIVTGGVIQVVI